MRFASFLIALIFCIDVAEMQLKRGFDRYDRLYTPTSLPNQISTTQKLEPNETVVRASFELQCFSTAVEGWQEVGKLSTCRAQNLLITRRCEIMKSASSDVNLKEVKALKISDQTVNFIPRFCDSLANRLEVLRVMNCHLKAISRNDLRQFLSLKLLDLDGNDLEQLSGNIFDFTRSLVAVDLRNNKLKFIGPNLLEPLSNLEKAWFGSSGCIDFSSADSPSELERLKSALGKCGKESGDNEVMSALRTKNEELEAEKCELMHANMQLEQPASNAEIKCNETQSLSNEMDNSRKLNSEMVRQLELLDREVSKLKGKAIDAEIKFEQENFEHLTANAELIKQVSELNQKRSENDKKLNQKISESATLKAQLNKEISDWKKKFSVEQGKAKTAEAKLQQKASEYTESVRQLALLSQEVDTLKVKAIEEKAKCEQESSGYLKTKAELTKRVSDLNEKLSKNDKNLNQKTSEIAKTKTQHSNEIGDWKKKLSAEQVKTKNAITKQSSEASKCKSKANEADKKFQQQTFECAKTIAQITKRFGSCDKNLDTATRALAPLLSQFDTNSTEVSMNEIVDIVCDRFSNETGACEPISFTIGTSSTEIGKVVDEIGNDVRPKLLIIRRRSAFFLPINLSGAFSGLKQLEVSTSGVFLFDQKTFEGFDQLININLTGNKVLRITSGSFAGLKQLEQLDLSHNNIKVIESDAFIGLDKLKVLNLSNNKLIEIASKFLSPTQSLEMFDISGNVCVDLKHPEMQLEDMEIAIADNCTAPVNFDCVSIDNSTKCLAEHLRVDHPKAKILKINGISQDQKRRNFTELIIEDQHVNFVPNQLAQSFPDIQKLAIHRSQLSLLSKNDFAGLSDLTWIEICDNNLTSIHAETFHTTSNVEHLILSSNHIQSLPPKVFEKLSRLTELRLSINEIKVLEANILPKVNMIRKFTFDNNKLEKIDTKVLQILKNSNEIDFSDNVCIDTNYYKDDEKSEKALVELFGIVGLKCTSID